jgi:type III secretion protein W
MKKEEYKAHVNLKSVTKLFFDITEERYPSAEKLVQLASRIVDPLGGSPIETVHVKIAVLTMVRDVIKQVAPLQFYRSFQHRDDLFLAVIEALEDLEDQLEELEEKELEEQEKESKA